MPEFSSEHHDFSKTTLGFWIYLMTDLIMFATLFAAYAALSGSTFGGPSGRELFSLPDALKLTIILLTSSFTCGLAMLSAHKGDKKQTLIWFVVTLLLGLSFLYFELNEFSHLINEGHTWQSSAFLSSFFALVGTHGAHIAVGSLWILVTLIQIIRLGLNNFVISKLTRLSLYWHFLDIVWIFIFTIVYLMAKI